ncbi:MAG: hypothetical protein NTU73_13805, partial [Ignavibacteriae bacterium]|nr:hypothetical protein [Ignavibacteriota bacterium]
LFSVIKVDNFNNYHEIWRTWRDKPWGSIHGNDGINFYSINLAEPFENDALYYFDMSYGVD